MTEATGPIVVPLDGSKSAEEAIPLAASLAQLYSAPIEFVHVLESEQVKEPGAKERADHNFRKYAHDLAAKEALAADACSTTVLAGTPADEVLSRAARGRFLALATHGRGGLKATFIGSVADKIVRGATIPVFLVPLGSNTAIAGKPVLAGLDGSAGGEAALNAARDVAAKFGSQVVLLRAYSMPPAVGIEFAPYPADLIGSLEADAQAYLKATAKPGERALVVMGSAPEAISAAADEIDAGLVTVASHGKGLGSRLALGSTTDRLMHTLKRPMFIVPAN